MILLNMLGCARPARMAANSSRVDSTDLSILPSASLRMSLITSAPCPASSRASVSARADDGADLLTLHRTQDVALGLHPEDDHRQLVLLAEGERRLVHDLESALDGVVVGQLVVLGRARVHVRVGAVDAV